MRLQSLAPGAEPEPAPARRARASARGGRDLGSLAYPLALVVVTLVLGFASISGSSVALHDTSGSAGTLTGRPREIRFDEFWVRTPLVVRQASLGLPEQSLLGVGLHDMGVQYDLPTGDWQTIVRPHHLPYRILGVERAFAFEWWIVFLVLPGVGVYVLMLACGVRPGTAALTSLVVLLSPVFQWWTVPATGTIIGYSSLAGASLVAATRARVTGRRVAWAALAGWLGACLVVTLYPPWMIPVGLVVGAVVVSVTARDFPWELDPRTAARMLVGVLGTAAAIGGVLVGAFVLEHHDVLRAVANSVYPGRRRDSGGDGPLRILLGAPFDVIEAMNGRTALTVNGRNQSEASSGVFLLAPIGAALLADARRALRPSWRPRIVLLAVLGVGAVLFAWYTLPVPARVGRFLLLDRVPSYRLTLPLMLASALAIGLFVSSTPEWVPPPLRRRAAVAGTAVFGLTTVWAAIEFSIDGHPVRRWQLVVLLLVYTTVVGVIFLRGTVGLAVLVGLLAVGAATVNPLQRGLDPLVDSPAARLGRSLREQKATGGVIVFANDPDGDTRAVSAMAASGVDLISGVNLYPNSRAWRILDPSETDRQNWDRYAHALWGMAPEDVPPRVFLNGPDSIIVMVDPCDARLRRIAVRTVVSHLPIERWCLTATRSVRNGPGRLYVYRIDRTLPRPAG